MSAVHVPVLLREVLLHLELQPGLIVVDGTVGAGGHSREILTRILPGGRLVGLDRDPMMLRLAGAVLTGPHVQLIHSTYSDLRAVLDALNIAAADRILVDLGLSSDQLADRERGFGFDAGGPLDMRFDPTQGRSAADWLNAAPESEIQHAFAAWGEIAQSDRLAASVTAQRRRHPFATADDLRRLASEFGRGRGVGKDPTPQIFQAVRIAVNSELQHLQTFLDDVLPECLAIGGRVGVISFHSLEDRMVKQAFRPERGWRNATKKPVEATPAEARINPRSRSARLRTAIRAENLSDRS